ncbi:MAG: glycosyltransferase family 2 protein [Leptolyngbyaceae cyanobacterium bins.59]|nr:glycosyltransferase family 2 protein [Leptolyngbyaceae cyanobacterium bins.59]
MASLQNCDLAQLPSFSLIVETENLSSAELDGLTQCLNSLLNQDIPITQANEVLITESGDVPEETIAQLRIDYPWLTVQTIQANTDYYEAKMKGVGLTTGEVIIFCDSDCIYESGWLRNLLLPFSQTPQIQVVAGETSLSIRGAYDLAMALSYIFPRFSGRSTLQKGSYYYCNNVAFRRNCLVAQPIPLDLPIYRGNCVVHGQQLTRQGNPVWQQPLARACHAAPNGLLHFFWRFLLLGSDAYSVSRLQHRDNINVLQGLKILVRAGLNKIQEVKERFYPVLTEDPRRFAYLPFALPIVLLSLVLFYLGALIAYLKPMFLLNWYNKLDASFKIS